MQPSSKSSGSSAPWRGTRFWTTSTARRGKPSLRGTCKRAVCRGPLETDHRAFTEAPVPVQGARRPQPTCASPGTSEPAAAAATGDLMAGEGLMASSRRAAAEMGATARTRCGIAEGTATIVAVLRRAWAWHARRASTPLYSHRRRIRGRGARRRHRIRLQATRVLLATSPRTCIVRGLKHSWQRAGPRADSNGRSNGRRGLDGVCCPGEGAASCSEGPRVRSAPEAKATPTLCSLDD